MNPFVSFLCPTFGRAPYKLHLLGEKVYWFLKQKYPNNRKELIILSDANNQTLYVDSDLVQQNVRVINYPHRFSTLGDKMNALIAFSKGEILIVDEDDDISLPNRAMNSALALNSFDYYDPGARWFQSGPEGKLIHDTKNCSHHASCYRKGKIVYPSINGSQDQWISRWALNELGPRGKKDKELDSRNLDYIYRFGVADHFSAHTNLDLFWKNKKAETGTFKITPVMIRDYEKEIKMLIEGGGVTINQ